MVLRFVEGLDEEDWERPTPLPGWAVGDVVAHLAHLEGLTHGFEQPSPPPDWSYEGPPLHQATNLGVAARRGLARERVVDELRRAVEASLRMVDAWTEEEWEETASSVVGALPRYQAMQLRVGDAYTHLLDMLEAVGGDLGSHRVAEAEEVLADRAVTLSGWAAVKRAGLAEGTRVRLELTAPGERRVDVVVVEGRGRLLEPVGDADGWVRGSGIGYALRCGGRRHPAVLTEQLQLEGDPARRLVETFRLFG